MFCPRLYSYDLYIYHLSMCKHLQVFSITHSGICLLPFYIYQIETEPRESHQHMDLLIAPDFRVSKLAQRQWLVLKAIVALFVPRVVVGSQRLNQQQSLIHPEPLLRAV